MTHARLTRKIPPSLSLDLDLPVAGVTALYGPAGSGKTLVLEMIAGFSRPDAGRILLDDIILFDAESQVDVPPRRRAIAWMGPQDALFPHMNVTANLKFAAKRLPRLERHRRVAEMLERFQLTSLARSRPADLTAAQKLRVGVARALVSDPKLLLFDDCGMDEPLFREIRAVTAAPVLLVTPDLDLCCSAAGTLVIVAAGRILQRGTPREVVDRPESIEVARALGVANLFQGTISALDPTRNTSRVEFDGFALNTPYIPGHFRGDQISIGAYPQDLRVHPGDSPASGNAVPARLVRAAEHTHTVRLEFEGPIFVTLSREDYSRQRDNKTWQVEFPPESLKIL